MGRRLQIRHTDEAGPSPRLVLITAEEKRVQAAAPVSIFGSRVRPSGGFRLTDR
jgi:hypothetical protein